VPAGGDSVRVDATLFDVVRERKLGEVQLIGDSRHMDRLVDSLAVNILRELGRTQDVSAVRTAGLRATSLPALKAFLEGEQLYRRGSWDSAEGAYRRALAIDSMFVPAIRHLAKAMWWRAPGDDVFLPLFRRAGELNHGLPRRDSLLVAADSLYAALQAVDDLPPTLRRSLGSRYFSTLEEAARVYPDDPEVWYELGEAREHMSLMGGVTRLQVLEAFDRSIALDSNFAPAYLHPMHLGLALYGLEGWRRYARPYFTLKPGDDYLRLLDAMLTTSPERSGQLDSLVRATRPDRILDAVFSSVEYPDSGETAVRLARALVSARGPATGFARDTVARRHTLAVVLAYRGHLREAQEHLQIEEDLSWLAPLPAEIALVSGTMPDRIAIRFDRLLRERPSRSPPGSPPRGVHTLMFALPWWAARRDTISIARFSRRADWARRTITQPFRKEIADYGVEAARAYALLARGDTGAALSHLRALPDDVSWSFSHQVVEGQILARSGRDAEALEVFDHAFSNEGFAGPVKVLTRLETARSAERVGQLKRATDDYQYVVDAWRHADPELHPYVSEARQGLARLTSEPRP
jgi:serine/threonine-protein kinase